jgi:vacuolar-type H+-ATPase subunit I/STV1
MDVLSIVWNVLLSGSVISVGIGAHWVWRQIQPTASKYFEEKAKNLANKQDLADLTHAVKKVEAEFNEKLESIKAEHQKELEGYKARLEQAKHISRVQFEKEFLIYGEIWEKLTLTLQQAVRLRVRMEQVKANETVEDKQDRKNRKISSFIVPYNDFCDCINKNKPFYHPEVYTKLTHLTQSA